MVSRDDPSGPHDPAKVEPAVKQVTHTRNRGHEREYVVQVHESLVEDLFADFPGGETAFIVVRNADLAKNPEIHVRYQTVGQGGANGYQQAGEGVDRERTGVGSDEIGLDFTLRYGLAVPATADVEHGDAETAGSVEVEPTTNREPSWIRRQLNRVIGVRPQICRVRMGVLPDLEDKVCRLPENTMQLLGIEEGDYICIESSSAARPVRSVKAFAIDDDTEEIKEAQEREDSRHYENCWEALDLGRLREPEFDIPDVYIDAETRSDLDLPEREGGDSTGVCQPVRIYRDPVGVLTKSAHEVAIPFALILVAQGIGTTGAAQAAWFGAAFVLILVGYLIRHRSMLGDYGLGTLLDLFD